MGKAPDLVAARHLGLGQTRTNLFLPRNADRDKEGALCCVGWKESRGERDEEEEVGGWEGEREGVVPRGVTQPKVQYRL